MINIHEDLYKFMISLAEFFLEWKMFQTKVVKTIRTHILCSVTFFQKLRHFGDNVESYGRGRRAMYDNIMLFRKDVICMPDNSGRNTYIYS
jgi:hypothetical protein